MKFNSQNVKSTTIVSTAHEKPERSFCFIHLLIFIQKLLYICGEVKLEIRPIKNAKNRAQISMNDLIIYNTPDGKSSIALYAKDGSVWLNQHQIAELFATSKQNISQHETSILRENELNLDSVVKNYFTTAADARANL